MAGDIFYNKVSLLLPMTGSDGSTTFTDQSPSPKTATVLGNAKISTTLEAGGNGDFDGVGDYLTIPNTVDFRFNTGDYTVEALVYNTNRPGGDVDNDMTIFGTLSGTGILFFSLNYATAVPQVWNGTTGINSTIAVPLNTWTHVAYSRSSGTVKIFVDGVQGASGTHNLDNSNATETIKIGGNGGGYNNRFFYGYMSSLRITKGVARYTTDFTPPDVPLPTYFEHRANHLNAVNRPIIQTFNPTIFNG